MKKYLILMLSFIMLFSSTITVDAAKKENEECYQLIEEDINISDDVNEDIVPYGKYIMNIQTTIKDMGSGKVAIRADVLCSSVVKTIDIKFTLQKNPVQHG